MIYVNISEFLTTGYKLEGSELFHFRELFVGQFAGMYWFYFYGGLMLPGLVALYRRTRTIPFIVGGTGTATRGVTLAIYDARGAHIATVVEGQRAPGTHEAAWDGRSGQGSPVPSGIYFVRLVVEGSAPATRKLVLLK